MSTMPDTSKRRRTRRRQFDDDFRAQAVRLVLDEGKTIAAAARDLDLTPSSLRYWVQHARADWTHGRTGLTTAEREELARLRKENRELRTERDILKKKKRPDRAINSAKPSTESDQVQRARGACEGSNHSEPCAVRQAGKNGQRLGRMREQAHADENHVRRRVWACGLLTEPSRVRAVKSSIVKSACAASH